MTGFSFLVSTISFRARRAFWLGDAM